jgi:DNA-binding response OmpR family regulator
MCIGCAFFAPQKTSGGEVAMKKILIVDDEFLIRYSLSHALINGDREISTASNGRDALKELGEHCYDLCLLDLHLPDMNGLDIMKELRKASPGTRIIIITGSVITEAMMHSIQENADLLIPKPFDLDEVKASADQLLTEAGPAASTALNDNEQFIQRFIKQVACGEERREQYDRPLALSGLAQ